VKLLLVLLVVLGVIISVTVVPGVFTTDDNNYLINVLSLRHGRFTIANTEGLPPSRELLFFDPDSRTRIVNSTPVGSTAPPLYAPLALPFVWLRWRGLIALNTLAYLVTIAMVFLYSRRYATDASTPWMAAAAFALGGFVIEYVQGLWPHALSIALCTAGIFAAGRVIDGRPSLAAAAGFLLGLATGVRYQNAAVVAVVGAGIALWSGAKGPAKAGHYVQGPAEAGHYVQKWRALTAYVLAAAVPLSASAIINHIRFGSWNPISKGGDNYLRVPLLEGSATSLLDPLVMFWARVVDFSVRPPLLGFNWVTYDPVTGAHLMMGATLQKSFLQSAPWAILAFIMFVVAWLPGFRIPEARQPGAAAAPGTSARRRQIQLLSLVTVAVFAVFAFAGVSRMEGLSFNQRYLLELLPLAAVGFAWALDGLNLRFQPVLVGVLWGVLLVVLILFGTPVGGGPQHSLWLIRILALLKLPLVCSAALTILWFVARSRESARPVLAAAAGLCLGWGLTLHLLDDVQLDRRYRGRKLAETEALGRVLTNGSALFGYAASKDAPVALLFDRDIVILDMRADDGKDAPMLIRELLGRGRKVFLLQDGAPGELLSRVRAGLHVVRIVNPGTHMVELRMPSPSSPQ
jgi:hypothetical protein